MSKQTDVSYQLRFKTQWDAIVWMRAELWKRGIKVNPMTKDFNDEVWFRYSEKTKQKKSKL